MKFGIAILPPADIQKLANSYRKRYDPHYKLIPPHITIKEAFSVESDEHLSTIITGLQLLAQKTPTFSLTINKFSTFYPTNNVIYLAIEKNEQINQLHQFLNKEEPIEDRPYPFVPHITIAQKLATDEMLDIYSGIKMNDVKAEFKVTEFHLFQQGEDKIWSIYHSFKLA